MVMLAALALLPSVEAAEPPSRLAWSLADGTGLRDLAVLAGSWRAAWIEDGSNELRLLDAETWTVEAAALGACPGPAGVALAEAFGGVWAWVGCEDGTVLAFDLGAAGTLTGAAETSVAVTDGAILGVEAAGDEGLVIVAAAEGGLEVWGIDLQAEAPGEAVLVATPTMSGYADAAACGESLVIAHGGDDVTKVTLESGASIRPEENLGASDWAAIDCDGGVGFWLADINGGVVRFSTGSNDYAVALSATDGLEETSALALAPVEGWVAITDVAAAEVWLYPYATDTVTVGDERIVALPGSGVDELAVLEGYLLGVGLDGVVRVFAAAPWVDITGAPTEALGTNVSSSLTFTSDLAGSWELRRDGPTGSVLATGFADAAVPVEVGFDVGEDWTEGANRLWVVVGDGHDAVDVIVDTPPGEVPLTEDGVGFGDERILLDFQGISDADLERYDVYLTSEPFEPSSWPSGGPAFAGPDDVQSPLAFEAEPGEAVSAVISPLTNGVVYYLAVRAVDAGGLEGPMSSVFQVMPEPTVGAAGLAGEPVGCGAVSGPRAFVLALLAAVAAAGRRAGGALALLFLAPGVARAADGEWFDAKRSGLELRYGPTALSDTNLATVYGETGNRQLFLEGGRVWYRMIELDIGIGLLREKGYTVGETSGEASSEEARLTVLPLSAGLTLRLDLFDGLPLVPYCRAGVDWYSWIEQTNDGTGWLLGETVAGGKPGYHYGAGLHVLLDPLGPKRASLVEARWGVKDTYLTVDWRKQEMLPVLGGDSGLSFAASTVGIGLRIDR